MYAQSQIKDPTPAPNIKMIEIKKSLIIRGFTVKESPYEDLLIKGLNPLDITMGELAFSVDKKAGKIEIEFVFDEDFIEGVENPEDLNELQEKIVLELATDIKNNIEDICGGVWSE